MMRELSTAVSGASSIELSESSLACDVGFAVALDEAFVVAGAVGEGLGAASATTADSPITNAAPTATAASARRKAIIMGRAYRP